MTAINALLIFLGYAAGLSILKWILDFRLPADSMFRGYETLGEEMWIREPMLYVVFLTAWPVTGTATAAIWLLPMATDKLVDLFRKASDALPEEGITNAYEKTYKRLTDD